MAVVENLVARIRADVSDFRDGMGDANSTLADTGKKIAKVGAAAAAAGAAVATAVGVKSVKAAAGVEDAITEAAVKTDDARGSIEKFSEAAKQAGQTSTRSATEAAQGLKFLASAGLSAEQSMDALPGVLQLAAAGSMDLANASDIATNVLSGMRLEVSELGRVNDVLVAASSAANTSVQGLGQAFSFVAPKANAVGMSVEQTSAIIGELANQGIKGSRAGRGLRSALSSLQNPSDKLQKSLDQAGISTRNASGEMRGFGAIMQSIQQSGDAKAIAGQMSNTAGAIVEALAPSSQAVQQLERDLNNVGGAAKKQADLMRESLGSQLKVLTGSVETLGISIGQKLSPVVVAVSDELTKMANEMSRSAEEADEAGESMGQLAENARSLTRGTGDLASSLEGVGTSLVGGGAFLTNFTSTVIEATEGAVGLREVTDEEKRGFDRLFNSFDEGTGLVEKFSAVSLAARGELDSLGGQTDEVWQATQDLNRAVDEFGLESQQAREMAAELNKAMGRSAPAIGMMEDGFSGLAQKAREAAKAMLGANVVGQLEEGYGKVKQQLSEAAGALDGFLTKKAEEAKAEEKANEKRKDRALTERKITQEFEKQQGLQGFGGDFQQGGGISEQEARRRGAAGFGLARTGGAETASLTEIGLSTRDQQSDVPRPSGQRIDDAVARDQRQIQQQAQKEQRQQMKKTGGRIEMLTGELGGLASSVSQLQGISEGTAAALGTASTALSAVGGVASQLASGNIVGAIFSGIGGIVNTVSSAQTGGSASDGTTSTRASRRSDNRDFADLLADRIVKAQDKLGQRKIEVSIDARGALDKDTPENARRLGDMVAKDAQTRTDGPFGGG